MKSPIGYNLVRLFFFMLFISGCNSGKNKKFAFFPASMQSTENQVCDLYVNYLENFSPPYFVLFSSDADAERCFNVELKQKIITDPDLNFFPATLWQMYALEQKSRWKDIAIYYTEAIQTADSAGLLFSGELVQSIFLNANKIDKNKNYRTTIIEVLSKHISKLDRKMSFPENEISVREDDLNFLLENKVLFFATKETGDPGYRKFAIENSSELYEKYFQNNLRIRSVSENYSTGTNIQRLTTDDFQMLAAGLFGFSVLYKETEKEDYLRVCANIASLFERVFNTEDNTIELEKQQELISKVDLLSQTLVCLTFLDLSAHIGDRYKETSSKIYHHILDELELKNSTDEVKGNEGKISTASFRLFYYLLEYEKRKQNML